MKFPFISCKQGGGFYCPDEANEKEIERGSFTREYYEEFKKPGNADFAFMVAMACMFGNPSKEPLPPFDWLSAPRSTSRTVITGLCSRASDFE